VSDVAAAAAAAAAAVRTEHAVVVRILVTFHYSLLLVTKAVGSRYLVFVTLIVTQALRAERGSRVAAAVILIPNSLSVAPSLYWRHAQLQRAANTLEHRWTRKTAQLQIPILHLSLSKLNAI